MTLQLVLPQYRLFPYERSLAEREIRALDLRIIGTSEDRLTVERPRDLKPLTRLTYVSTFEGEQGVLGRSDVAVMEDTHRALRGRGDARQATRYHLHGIHEYKGKFNPQVVRAFANLLGIRPGDWLLDPFCGSGTALLEGLSFGANVFGIDRSPMAAYLARAKAGAMRSPKPSKIAASLERWLESALPEIERAERDGYAAAEGLAHLDAPSVAYLERWFTAPALAGLSEALRARLVLRGNAHRLAGIAISSLCRTVSLQAPEDLRVRKRPAGFVAPAIGPLLQAAVQAMVLGLSELDQLGEERTSGRAIVRNDSAGTSAAYRGFRERTSRCAVITSPPYATALPYIDTDRLSIILLGLAPEGSVRELERSLIGSREWNTPLRRAWTDAMQTNAHGLPTCVTDVCGEIAADMPTGAGFRRTGVAPLLYRYFYEMRESLSALRAQLRAGEEAVFIVGNNRTSGRDSDFLIETPGLLSGVARQVGFRERELLPLETWPRFGLHQSNGIASEAAVWLVASE